jgi:hypothetical protein
VKEVETKNTQRHDWSMAWNQNFQIKGYLEVW